MVNKYYWHSRLSERKFRQIVRCFAGDYNAAETADKTGLDRKSINNIFVRIRRRIVEASLKKRLILSFKGSGGTVPCFVAESETECGKYSAKYESSVLIAVFENGFVRSEIVYAETKEILAKIKRFVRIENEKVTGHGFYNVIGNLARLNQWDTRLFRREYIESYPGNLLLYFRLRSKKLKGITREKFILHLRESEWRFNKITDLTKTRRHMRVKTDLSEMVTDDLYKELLKILKTNPL